MCLIIAVARTAGKLHDKAESVVKLSPSVKEWDTADPTIGDVHQWEVWAGKGAPYQDWDVMGGRFVRSAIRATFHRPLLT